MSILTAMEKEYQSRIDVLTSIREQYHETDEAGRDALRGPLNAAKDAVDQSHARYTEVWRTAIASCPVDIRLVNGRTISISQSGPGIGGAAKYLSPGDAGYDDALAVMEDRRAVDARVSEAAYRAWGWRGPVRIDYYGIGDDCVARVSDGSRVLSIRPAELPV